MGLEATMICLDNSEWSRDGDYSPSRWEAQQDAANRICGIKTQQNAESAVGIMAMAGPRVEVLSALTTDIAKILAAIHSAQIQGKCDLYSALNIAQLALKHRQNKSQKQRIIAFICSPVGEEVERLTSIGMKLRRNNVALDLICFGDIGNVEKLQELQRTVNASDNSHLVTIPSGAGILSDALVNTPIFQSDDAGPMGVAGGQGNFEEYGGYDPNTDPEMALAMQLSLQEAQANRGNQEQPGVAEPAAPVAPISEADAHMEIDEDDEELQAAIRMSLMEEDPEQPQAQSPQQEEEKKNESSALFQDESYVASLLSTIPGVNLDDPAIQEALKRKDEEEKKKDSSDQQQDLSQSLLFRKNMFRTQTHHMLNSRVLARGFATSQPAFLEKTWALIKKESKKVMNGCTLLYHDAKFMTKKKYNITFYGERATLKEIKAMEQTSSDLLKMIPFSVFVLIPGAELLLPPTLYIFPNMLPSSFVAKSTQEEIIQAILERRPYHADKMHRYLLENGKNIINPEAEQLYSQLRSQPQTVTVETMIKNFELFYNEFSFGRMNAEQLKSVCRLLCLEPWTGFKTFNKIFMIPISRLLNYFRIPFPREYKPNIFPFSQIERNIVMLQLRQRIRQIRNEDFKLLGENIDTMSSDLLVQCCRERAIDTEYSNEKQMRNTLKKWVKDSTTPSTVDGRVPSEMLIYEQSFQYLEDCVTPVEYDVHEEAEEEADYMEVSEESLERVLNYDKKELLNMLSRMEEANLYQMPRKEREDIEEKLKDIIDEKLFLDQHDRILDQLTRISDVYDAEAKVEGPDYQPAKGKQGQLQMGGYIAKRFEPRTDIYELLPTNLEDIDNAYNYYFKAIEMLISIRKDIDRTLKPFRKLTHTKIIRDLTIDDCIMAILLLIAARTNGDIESTSVKVHNNPPYVTVDEEPLDDDLKGMVPMFNELVVDLGVYPKRLNQIFEAFEDMKQSLPNIKARATTLMVSLSLPKQLKISRAVKANTIRILNSLNMYEKTRNFIADLTDNLQFILDKYQQPTELLRISMAGQDAFCLGNLDVQEIVLRHWPMMHRLDCAPLFEHLPKPLKWYQKCRKGNQAEVVPEISVQQQNMENSEEGYLKELDQRITKRMDKIAFGISGAESSAKLQMELNQKSWETFMVIRPDSNIRLF